MAVLIRTDRESDPVKCDSSLLHSSVLAILFTNWLCIKLGRGHWDPCVGTWGREMRDLGRQVWDTRTSGTGTRDVKYRDAGCE